MLYGHYNFAGDSLVANQGSYFVRLDDGGLNLVDHDFMIEFWIRTTATTGDLGIIGKKDKLASEYGFEVHLLAGTQIAFYLKSNSGAAALVDQTLGLTGINDGEWHHIVIIFNRDGNAVGYDNGVVGGSPVDISTHDNASISNVGNFHIGARFGLTTFFDGDISSPRLYDFGFGGIPAGLQATITWNYNNPGSIHDDLVGYLTEYWEWDKTPYLIGAKYKALEIGTAPEAYYPTYVGGQLLSDTTSLLLYQFRNAANFKALLEAKATVIQDFMIALNDVQYKRTLVLAIGAQLDGIGDIVGEPRGGRNDADYREGLYFRILVNASKAIPDAVINACAVATNATMVVYLEIYPAKIELITDGLTIPSNLREILEAVSPVAVGIDSIILTYGGFPMFFWLTEYGAQQGLAFAELNTSTGLIYWYGGKLAEVI